MSEESLPSVLQRLHAILALCLDSEVCMSGFVMSGAMSAQTQLLIDDRAVFEVGHVCAFCR